MENEIYPVNVVKESKIEGRRVAVYSINTAIGEIFISQHEAKDYEIITDFMGYNKDKAMKLYDRNCRNILKGKEN